MAQNPPAHFKVRLEAQRLRALASRLEDTAFVMERNGKNELPGTFLTLQEQRAELTKTIRELKRRLWIPGK